MVALGMRKHPRAHRNPAALGIARPRNTAARSARTKSPPHTSGRVPASHKDHAPKAVRCPSPHRPPAAPAPRHGRWGRSNSTSGSPPAPPPGRPKPHGPHRHLAARAAARASSSAISMKDRKPRLLFILAQISSGVRGQTAPGANRVRKGSRSWPKTQPRRGTALPRSCPAGASPLVARQSA